MKEIIKVGALEIKFILEPEDTNGQMAMFELLVPAGAKVPLPHYHEAYDETIYGIEGVTTFTIDGVKKELRAGECLFIPRGVAHGFNNFGETDCKALAIVTPALISPDYFIALGEIVNAGGPPDMEKVKLVFKDYGIVPVFPKADS